MGMMAFSLVGLVFIVFILVIIGVVIGLIVRGLLKRSKTSISSVASAYVKVISRRTEEIGGNTAKYFVTFEMESGQRLELELTSNEYGLLTENDKGQLTFQGTQFKRFKRSED